MRGHFLPGIFMVRLRKALDLILQNREQFSARQFVQRVAISTHRIGILGLAISVRGSELRCDPPGVEYYIQRHGFQ